MRRGIYFINITVPRMNIHVSRDINREAAVGFDEMEFQLDFKGDTSRVYSNVRICIRCFPKERFINAATLAIIKLNLMSLQIH